MPWSRFSPSGTTGSGGANWVQNTPVAVTVNTTIPTVIASVTFTSLGQGPAFAFASGDGNSNGAGDWNIIRMFLNGSGFGTASERGGVDPFIISQQAQGFNNPFSMVRSLGVLAAGNHTIEVRAYIGQGSVTYGEAGNTNAPSLLVFELI